MTVTHLDSGARHASCGRVLPLSPIETYMPTTPRLPKLRNFLLVLVLVCVVSCRPHAPASRQAAADPVAGLSLDVPATTFVLPNGLTVVVHEDHRSEEHTSELQSLMRISYAVFCLKKKKQTKSN